ncbi:hypothetical protein BKA66DRAFT_180037 [Pyrenochaeta sp. MPI-SDFR-AT-0127]|nr:hypothetical protein BKA66DRAFT_180037 [Pyrenochaeta sp. MPI-SDFR-AT-0127]
MNSSSAVSANPDVVIATVVSDIARDFLSLADVLKIDPRFTAQVSPESIHDEFSRFKLWAGNIAAHRKGRRSLEYRLRDAAHLKTQTLNLLSALSEALHNALAIARGEKVPWDENVDSDSELSDEGSSKDDLQGSTELKQLLASTRTIITSLFRLSMAIRDPAPNNQSKSNLTIDKSFFEQHDIQHVKEKFPDSPMYLQDRLGRAISGRRQYLSYREEHHQKLTKNIEKIGFEKPTTEFTTNSTEATPIPGIGRLNSVNVLEEGEDAASQTSYAPSENANIRVPPLPKEAHNKDFFECPLCFLLVSIHTAAGWKQHVYRDLHPYCCTFEHCTTADRLYESRKSWFAHELEVHRTSWQCIEGCGKLLQTEADFEHHVQKRHADLASNRLYHALKRTSAKSASLQDSSQCALCGKRMSLRALQKHLGSHQQQLALFALPPNLNETEEPNSQEEGSIIVKNNGDEDISDISDKPESENSDVDDAPDPGESSNTNDLLQDLQEIKTEWSSYIREQCEAFITRPPQGRLERETTFADLKNLVLFQIQTRLNRLKKVHILAKQCAELEAEVSGTVEWMCTVMNKYSVTTEDMTTVSSGGSFQEANVPLKNITSEASYPEERPLDSDSSHRAQSIPLSPSSIDKGLLQYSPQLPENFPILETRNESTPTPSKTIMMDLNAIDAQFEQEFLPLCHEFLTNQATEADLRKRQHQALSESILVSIILKLDKVETDGNEDARIKRKEIVKRVQSILNRLDAKLMGTSTVVEQPRKQYNPAANPGEANSTILDEREKNLELEGQVESYDQQLSDMYKSRDGPQIVPKVETSSQENEEALAPQEYSWKQILLKICILWKIIHLTVRKQSLRKSINIFQTWKQIWRGCSEQWCQLRSIMKI